MTTPVRLVEDHRPAVGDMTAPDRGVSVCGLFEPARTMKEDVVSGITMRRQQLDRTTAPHDRIGRP
jgi:hypothetical protein